jgi:hypothetical protein
VKHRCPNILRFRFIARRLPLLVLLFVASSRAQLSSVSVTPSNSAAGASGIHTVTFTMSTAIPVDGKIVITYPSGFDYSSPLIASSTTMDGSLSAARSGDVVTITRSGGTVQAAGGAESILIANITNATAVSSSYTIMVQTTDNADLALDSGSFLTFTVTPGPLDHFTVTGPGASQIAGNAFTVTVTAQDYWSNTVTSFVSTADLADLTGTLSPLQTTAFTSGTWSGNVQVTRTTAVDNITARAQGKSGTTSNFRVDPTVLDHFEFGAVTSPRTAGAWFGLTLTAKDTYGNVKTDYTGTVTLSEKTASLEIQSTGTAVTPAFGAGTWSGNASILTSGQDVQITAAGSGRTGLSGYFNVDAAALDHFGFSPIADGAAGTPFSVTVTAFDANENIVTAFTGTGNRVTFTYSGSGTLTPAQSGNFYSGSWTGPVTISQTQSNLYLSADDGSGHTATSNAFDITASAVDHFVFSSVSSSQTAGSPFTVTLRAVDASGNTVTAFSGTVNLKDESGTVTPQQVTFASGVWTGAVTITKSLTGDFLTVTGAGKSGTSGTFTVAPAAVASFKLSDIPSPRTAGTGFSVTFTALDAFGNTATGFTGTVNLSGGTVSVSPSATGTFAAGVRTQTLTITQARSDVRITATDAGSHTGVSNYFNVIHGALDHFAVGTIADPAAGMPFSVTATAQDANNNTVIAFNGAGNTVSVSHSGAGTVSPAVSGVFANGVWTGNLTIAQTQASDRLTFTRTGGSQTGISNTFAVIASAVDHFVIDPVPDNRTAGVAFAVVIRAVDSNGNPVTSYAGTAALADETGTGAPASITFASGLWNGSMTITRSYTGNSLTVTGGGKSGTSNEFTVRPAGVASFVIGLIGSPKAAGIAFPVTITALDAYGNTATGFTATAALSDGAGTITPTVTGPFSSGVRTESVMILHADQDVTITASDGAGHAGTSNLFNVLPGSVDHFAIAAVGSQVAKVPFTVIVTALDRFGSQATSFTGTVDISDLSGSISPGRSGSFIAGQWSGGVTIGDPRIGDRISVVRTGGLETGSSNSFDVNAPPGIRITGCTASRTEVTAGQNQDWTLNVAVRNLASSNARFDSLWVRFRIAGARQNDYQLVLPAVLRRSGTAVLAGNSEDTLTVRVDRTGRTPGDVTVEAVAFFTDGGTGGVVSDQGFAGIAVQDSARLRIDAIRVSQPEVTLGQVLAWTVSVQLTNTGGSTVRLDTSRSVTFLLFSAGSGWELSSPQELGRGGWVLPGGVSDSLRFIVERSAPNQTGFCQIASLVTGTEINTGRTCKTDTTYGVKSSILIETPASLSILRIDNLAPNRPNVNVYSEDTLRVYLQNTGGDGLRNLQLIMNTDGLSMFTSASVQTVDWLPGGGLIWVDFSFQAAAAPSTGETFTVYVDGFRDNTKDLIPEITASSTVVIQNPAMLRVSKIAASSASLIGGQKEPWTVEVTVRNLGQAPVQFDAPKAGDLTFRINGLKQSDYSVTPPSALSQGGLILAGGRTDALVYTVTSTGSLGGIVDVQAAVSGRDRNSRAVLSSGEETSVYVRSDQSFRIIATRVQSAAVDDAGNGTVNTGRNFEVLVLLENGLGLNIEDIRIGLTTDGGSEITASPVSIDRLTPAQWDTAVFAVKASAFENAAETFRAKILQAYIGSPRQLVPVGAALDSTAQVAVQTPVRLSLSLSLSSPDGRVSAGQVFTVRADLENFGSSRTDGMAGVRLVLADHFERISESDTAGIAPGFPVEWSVRAPVAAPDTEWVAAELFRLPNDFNTGETADVEQDQSRIRVITVASRLSAELRVTEPAGAADGIVSAGQSFVLTAIIYHYNTRDITATLELPSGYATSDAAVKSLRSYSLSWQIEAPAGATPKSDIRVRVQGMDSLQHDVPVPDFFTVFPVTAVRRADLSMSASITAPADVAQTGTVAVGQEFVITTRLVNLGEADTTGFAAVTLDPLPEGYTTLDPLARTVAGGTAAWTVKAPAQQSVEAVTIRFRLSAVPADENTGRPAYVSRPNDAVAVSMAGAWLALEANLLPAWSLSTVTPGQDGVKLLIVTATNRGMEGSGRISIEGLTFQVEDRFGDPIPPSSVISRLTAVSDADSTDIFGSTSSLYENPIRLSLSRRPSIPVGESVSIAVLGRISDAPETGYFQINIPSGDFVDAREPNSGNSVSVKTAAGEDWTSLRSDPKKIFEPETEPALWNSPNPFSPSDGPTAIHYYLEKSTAVSFHLFTLTGEPVWSVSFDASDDGAAAGLHTLLWDGRNSQSHGVLNGVYFLFMKPADGSIRKTKIAVMK